MGPTPFSCRTAPAKPGILNSVKEMTTLFRNTDKENTSRTRKLKWEKHDSERITKWIRTKN